MTKPGLHAIYGLYLPNRPLVILYVGSWCVATLDERLRQHREGKCKTTSKCAARHGIKMLDLHMRVLRYWMLGIEPNPEGEITKALQVRGQGRWNGPYALSTEDSRRGGYTSISKMSHEARIRGAHIGGRNATAKMTPEQLSERGRIGGRVGGRKLAESGYHQTPEGRKAAGRGGLIGGRKLKEMGWHETGEGHEHHVRVGHMGSHEDKVRAGRIGGHNGSHETHIRVGRMGTVKGTHTRWHINRGIVNPKCPHCKGAEA